MADGTNPALTVGWATKRTHTGMTSADVPVSVKAAIDDPASADDRSLVAAFLLGHREAFDEIVRRHQRQVYQVCRRFVGNHEDAADLTQDVFVRAFKGLPRFKGDAALGTWLYRVAVNASLNRVAVKRPETEPIDARPRIDTRAHDPLDRVMRGERAVAVRAAIRKLPRKQQAALVLRTYQELTHEEIAAIVGSSVGAVKANVFHALANLRRLLQS